MTVTVTVGQGFKYVLARDIQSVGGTHVSRWRYDVTSTEVSVECRYKSADFLQRRLWDLGYSWVSVKPFARDSD